MLQSKVQGELVKIQPDFKTELLSAVEQFHVDMENFEENYETVSDLNT